MVVFHVSCNNNEGRKLKLNRQCQENQLYYNTLHKTIMLTVACGQSSLVLQVQCKCNLFNISNNFNINNPLLFLTFCRKHKASGYHPFVEESDLVKKNILLEAVGQTAPPSPPSMYACIK